MPVEGFISGMVCNGYCLPVVEDLSLFELVCHADEFLRMGEKE